MLLSHYLLIILLKSLVAKKIFSPENTLVFGPGLNVDNVLPGRYFYIQAVDNKGKNYTESLGEKYFQVKFQTVGDERRVRVQIQILDRNDGSYIVRYRFYQTYDAIKIEVKRQDTHVAKSPYILKGLVYHEQCYCPEYDTDKWIETMKCPTTYDQINNDLKPFPKINFDDIHEDIIKSFGKNHAICHYSVINNQVYRKCYGEHVGFAIFMDAWLLSLARKVRLPDMEFFSNLGDWPLSRKGRELYPIMSWCGSDDTNDIVMPTYDLTESTLETMGRVSLDMQSVQGKTGPHWKKKIAKGFFRGRDSRQERLDLTILGRNNTDLFDVALTNFFFFPYDEKLYGSKNQRVSFFDFFKYKYQLNIDGTVAAYRLPYLLVGDSVVLKQDSKYYEHFYHDLQPMKHYIPLKHGLSDVKEKIMWAKENDKIVKAIGRAGQLYARDNLMADRLFCYSYILFKEYASRLTSVPKIRRDQEHIKQPEGRESECNCERKASKPKTHGTTSSNNRQEL